MKKADIRLEIVKRWIAWDVCVRIIGATMNLELAGDNKCNASVADFLHLPASCDCPDQTKHNDFQVREGRSTKLFVRNSSNGPIFLLLYTASHNYVDYLVAEKSVAKLTRLKQIWIRAFPVFVRHGKISMDDVSCVASSVYGPTRT